MSEPALGRPVVPGATAHRAPRARRRLPEALTVAFQSPIGIIGIAVVVLFCAVAVLAPHLAPHAPLAIHELPDGRLARLQPPSAAFPLGTTYYGRDVLSQLIAGSRTALIVGILSTVIMTVVGTGVGLTSGYYGGRTDSVLMRLTDIAFGVPFLPFAVVLVALLQPSIWNIVFAISLLMWRTTARVIRAQVLSLRERPFVRAARVAGAGDLRIMFLHIYPNVLPMSLLYVAFGVAWAVLAEASLSFLGFGDPEMVSWGQMLYYAYITGSIRVAWWWAVPPGLCITLFVSAIFLVGREYERFANPRLR